MIEKPSTKNNSNSKINLNDLREEIHLHRYKSKSVKLKIRFYKFIYLTSSYFRIIIFFFLSRIMKVPCFSTQRCTHAKAIFLREKEYYLFVVPDKVP